MKDRMITRDCLHYMKAPMIVMFFGTLMRVAFPTVSAYLLGGMTDSLLALDRIAIMQKLPYLVISIVFSVLVVPATGFITNYLLVRNGYRYDAFLVEKYMDKELGDIEKNGTGALVEGVDADAEFCYSTCQLFAVPLVLVAYIVFLFLLLGRDATIFTSLMVFVPMLFILRAILTGKNQGRSRKYGHEYNGVRRGIEERVVPTAEWLRSWGMTGFYNELLMDTLHQWMDRNINWRIRFESALESSRRFLDVFIQIVVLFGGIVMIALDRLTPGELLAGWLMLESVEDCYSEISEWFSALRARSEVRKNIEIFYGESESELDTGVDEALVLTADDIDFSYESDKPVLDGFSTEFWKGRCYRLTGGNGAGKSTFIRIISGLYRPDSGYVTEGEGTNLSEGNLRRLVTLAEQDSVVFSGTVAENLFTDDLDGASGILDRLGFEKTLDYKVGRDGKGLSPGEKKKLILARALSKGSDFLVLDEPLNHLDRDACIELERILREDDRGRIIISHKDMNLEFDGEVSLERV